MKKVPKYVTKWVVKETPVKANMKVSGDGETKEVKTGGGVFLPLLTVLFIGLKLTGYINWSWWWVLAPLWIPLTVVFVILLVFYCWS